MDGASPSCDVDDVVITGDLDRRPSRVPDYEGESIALTSLAEAMSSSPGTVLQRLVEVAKELTRSDSAGISLLEPGGQQGRFRWAATTGAWALYCDGQVPREQSPCGEVIAREAVLLMHRPDRAFPALLQAQPPIEEGLLAPFTIDGEPAGTLWTIMHRPEGRFETEDARLIKSLARFASAAHRMVVALEAAKAGNRERQAFLLKFSDMLRPLADPLTIEETAARLLGEHLGASRCGYGEADHTGTFVTCHRDYHAEGMASFAGTYRTDRFDEVIAVPVNAGTTTVLDDEAPNAASSGPAVAQAHANEGSLGPIGAPLLKDGRLVAMFFVQQRMSRPWSPDQVALIEDVAERTWAAVERARAEHATRDSEERFRAVTESIEDVFYMTDLDRGALLYLSPSFEHIWGLPPADLLNDLSRFADTILPEDRPIVAAALAQQQNGQPVATEYRIMRPDGAVRWINDRCFPVPGSDARRSAGVATDITARKATEAALSDSETRFRQFSDASSSILWIRDAATLRMEFASPAFDTVYGMPGPDRGGDDSFSSWVRLIEPDNRQFVLDNFRRLRAGERMEQEFQVRRASDGALRWIYDTDFPLFDAGGDVRWVAGLGADITDARKAADLQGVLVAELQHRTRNLIAVVRSLSDRTLGNATSLEDFGKRFRLRLAALSRVQGLLSNMVAGEKVTFDELLRTELAAHGANDGMAEKVTLSGPAGVRLRSSMVQTFALALHELATNAVKYGALAFPDGHLFVNWDVQPASGSDPPRLRVEWREAGVPVPDADTPACEGGYGRELIERALPYQLKAETSYELAGDGVRCTIAVPISRAAYEGVLTGE